MTYSMLGRDAATGAFGGVVGTSSLAVGNRCLAVRHGLGAVLSQHRTDPRLATKGLDALAHGLDAEAALATIRQDAPGLDWRQLAVIDGQGRTAAFHGDRLYSIHAAGQAQDCVAIGNIIDNPDVPQAMADAFTAAAGQPLAERLIAGLLAGRDAGGEVLEPIRSAALQVTGPDGVAAVDLRVDQAEEAAGALADLLAAYGAQAETLRRVALEPDAVPVSRTLFEASVTRIAALGLQDRFPTAARRDDWTIV